MIKTVEELKAQARAKQITFYPVHECSFCGYICGYFIDGDAVSYNSGCYCVPYSNVQPRGWNELAGIYNLNQPENNPGISKQYLYELNQVWQFDGLTLEASA